jgi:hypothetical protein
MSSHHFHAVIWIDHHEARVFHFNPTDVERLVLHPDRQGKGNVLLFPRNANTRRDGHVQCRERLGGLLRYYHQEAA